MYLHDAAYDDGFGAYFCDYSLGILGDYCELNFDEFVQSVMSPCRSMCG